MSSFKTKIDEDFSDMMRKLNLRISRSFGSEEAAGRLDLEDATDLLMKQWLRYAGQQEINAPSISSLVGFFKDVVGVKMTPQQAFIAIFGENPGTADPSGDSPHRNEIEASFNLLRRGTIDVNDTILTVNKIAQWAKTDRADRTLIVKWMNTLGAAKPEVLKRRELAPLMIYAHGGVLTRDQLTNLLKEIAKVMLRNEARAAGTPADPNAARGTDRPTADADEDIAEPVVPGEPIPKPPGNGSPETETEVTKELRLWCSRHQLDFDRIMQTPIPELENYSALMAKTYMVVNELSARIMQYFGRLPNNTDFVEHYDSYWPRANKLAVWVNYRFGGPIEPVVTDLNYFIRTPQKARQILGKTIKLRKIQHGDTGAAGAAGAGAAGV